SQLSERELDPTADGIPDLDNTGVAPPEFSEAWKKAASSYYQSFGLSFGIRVMLPVLGESFINFLMYALMNKTIRGDKRLREHTFREPLDIRVRLLHQNCLGFLKPIDCESKECSAFFSLRSERNDVLHGNVAPKKLSFNEVLFRGTVPIYLQYKSMWDR